MKNILFYLGVGTIFSHEMDAMTNHEWRVLPVFRSLPEDIASTLFVVLHIPLIAAILWLVATKNRRVRVNTKLGVSSFLVVHAMAHFFSSADPRYEFASTLSSALIYCGALFGLGYLALHFKNHLNPARELN